MSVNYSITKASEQELKASFFKFYSHVYKTWNQLVHVLEEKTKITLSDLEQFFQAEEKSNRFKAHILDQCIWNISRCQPIANHLRFVIAIMYSINDLERMADYIISSARYIYQHAIDEKPAINLIVTTIKNSIEIMNKMIRQLKNPMNIKKNYLRAHKKTVELAKAYRVQYNASLKKLSGIMFKQDSAQDINNIMTGIAVIMKSAERNVDHALNIIENFIYIRNADFFFDKKSKQELPSFDQEISQTLHLNKENRTNKSNK